MELSILVFSSITRDFSLFLVSAASNMQSQRTDTQSTQFLAKSGVIVLRGHNVMHRNEAAVLYLHRSKASLAVTLINLL